jgi:hypothetical protein
LGRDLISPDGTQFAMSDTAKNARPRHLAGEMAVASDAGPLIPKKALLIWCHGNCSTYSTGGDNVVSVLAVIALESNSLPSMFAIGRKFTKPFKLPGPTDLCMKLKQCQIYHVNFLCLIVFYSGFTRTTLVRHSLHLSSPSEYSPFQILLARGDDHFSLHLD